MFGRKFLFWAVLSAAVGLPYALWNKDWRTTAKKTWQSWTEKKSEDGLASDEFVIPEIEFTGNSSSSGRGGPDLSRACLTGEPVQNLEEVLRFDITQRWIMSRWARVSTSLADLNLEGLRVPLVTGTDLDDLAGSLTYYFDKQHQVRRITFHGYTGDGRKLVDLVTQRYGLRPEPSLEAGLYLAKWNGKPTSALRIRHATVVRSTAPHARLEVLLEINRPGKWFGVSPELEAVLKQDQGARRW